MFLGLCIYSRTRNEKLVDILYEHGLSISYDRVLDIHNAIGDFVVERFVQNGVVCPLSMKRGVFTIAAVDNIDHNPTATSSKTSFHGTSISLFQHSPNNGIEQEKLVVPTGEKKKKISRLPESYTDVKPPGFMKQPLPPTNDSIPELPETIKTFLSQQFQWLEKVSLTEEWDSNVKITWSSHHADQLRERRFDVGVSSLLPLLRDQAHDVTTIKHVMDKIKDAVHFLNPTQSPIITADQPLFALATQIKWTWSQEYGKFVIV